MFWPIASASTRLYCAQLEADKGTVDSLLQAIKLVEALPSDHPLRHDINRLVEEWAVSILDMAEEKFQDGKLEQAIEIARKIPANVQVYRVVNERIEKWRGIWEDGEEIFAQVEEELRESNWNQAFREAVKLLSIENTYWATNKYDDTIKQIQLAQEESSQLDTAYQILRRGGIDNWLAAITEAEKISPKSYAHREAQNLITKAKDKIVDYIDGLVNNRSWQALLDTVERLPETLSLSDYVNDWKTLASAGLEADQGTVENLKTAVTTLQEIESERPLYEKAQELVTRWTVEIEDVAHLEKARNLAQGGSINELNGAIASAQLIASANPRYQEAQKEIRDWTYKIQLIEDQPVLDQARDLSRSDTIPALTEAIAQAQQIGKNRALSGEAQQEIRKWRFSIETQEDQPLLDQAISLGNSRDYESAIRAAQQIRQGKSLYQEAQTKIGQWRRETRAQRNLQEAYLIADARTPQALVSAISVVRRIPSSTDASSQVQQALNRWAYQLLSIAQDQANRALLQEAINLARMVPAESTAYQSAIAQIDIWKKLLQPAVTQPLPQSSQSNPLVETNYNNYGGFNQQN
ncbi:hypothetical protein AsFPU1_2264 [Aphanothece sacrum FPU1]|uniref:Chromosome segregation ATPase n=2 Tax=Aphanothece sacrum TaxID=1122 RepID=A0A401IHS9_APHSA|nr:hypothetical protein AsFPU1_2264 [Aphanothece sacrum FPU1]GBF85643.1 hypothetical protein AsFPU3_2707 [Aphanothece sacrum FPU3]